MTPPRPATVGDDVRQQILDAALRRFQTYGLGKTTMAEIAEDTGMSAANLYRYFENKQDIAGACACRCMNDGLQVLREAMRRPAESAAARLEDFTLTMLRFVFQRAVETPNVEELVNIVTSRRAEVLNDNIQSKQALIAEILAEGNASGEFDVPDVIATAAAVHDALLLFATPVFMRMDSLEHFEEHARAVVRLLVRGLARR